MEHLLASKFGEFLRKRKIIQEEYFEVYVYGAELFLSFIVTTLIIAVIAVLSGTVLMSLAHLILFIALRRLTGGYHADTYLKCKLLTVGVYVSVIILAQSFDIEWYSYLILIFAGNTIIHFKAPVENPNKPLSDKQKRRLKVLSHIVFSGFVIFGSALSFLDQLLSNTVFLSLASVLASIIVTVFKKGGTRIEKQNSEDACGDHSQGC